MKRIRYILKKNSMSIVVLISLLVLSVISLLDFNATIDASYRGLFPIIYYYNEKIKGQELVDNNQWLPVDLLSFLSNHKKKNNEYQFAQIDSKEKQGNGLSKSQLSSQDYLLSNIYSVDSTTTLDSKLLDGNKLIKKDLSITLKDKKPKILIYHTHGSEGFADSVIGKTQDTVIGVGDYLASQLEEKYHIPVYHDKTVYDIIHGKLDRSRAYTQSGKGIENILKKFPSIEVIIDVHRDGVAEGTRLITKVNGKPTAQVMFFNGISYTNKSGTIDYLYNPYIKDNLAFTLQLQNQSMIYYPEWTRKIYVRGYRYNLHYRPRSLLVEVGAQTNTVEEAKNAMIPLAHVLSLVLLE